MAQSATARISKLERLWLGDVDVHGYGVTVEQELGKRQAFGAVSLLLTTRLGILALSWGYLSRVLFTPL